MRRRHLHRRYCLAAPGSLLIAAYAGAQNSDGFVSVYEDSLGTQPCAAITPYHVGTLYVLADLAGASVGGITGAEFRIEVSNPTGWLFSYAAPPNAALAVGNPLDTHPEDPTDTSGINLAFATCQTGVNGKVRLGTIAVFNVNGAPTDVVVKRHGWPSNPTQPCALFTLCDAPVFSVVCMSASEAAWCSIGPGVQKVVANDAPISTTSVHNASSGVVRPVPETVDDGVGWVVNAFAAGATSVHGFIYADSAVARELDSITPGLTLTSHDGTWGEVVVDWAGLHALSRRQIVLFEETFAPHVAAKGPSQIHTAPQTRLWAESFDRAIPSAVWPVTKSPASPPAPPPQNKPYWGSLVGDGDVYCARLIDPGPAQRARYSSYYDNMDTRFNTELVNSGGGIYIGNANNVEVRYYFRGDTEANKDFLQLLTRVTGGSYVGTAHSGDLDDPPLSGSTTRFIPDGVRTRLDVKVRFTSDVWASGYQGAGLDSIVVWGDIVQPFNLQSSISSVIPGPGAYQYSVTVKTINAPFGAAAPPSRTGLVRFAPLGFTPASNTDCDIWWPVPQLGAGESFDHPLVLDYDPTGKTATNEYVDEQLVAYADVDRWLYEDEFDNRSDWTLQWLVELPPIILVHGLMGGELQKTLGNPTLTTVWEGSGLDIARTLLFQHNRLMLTPGETEVVGGPMVSSKLIRSFLWPGVSHWYSAWRNLLPNNQVLMPYFGQVLFHTAPDLNVWTGTIDRLQSHGYHMDGPNPNLFEFHYDWRKQIQSPSTFAALEALINTAKAANPASASRLMVITHSMGGLVVQGYANSKNHAAPPQPHGIHSWISLGAPFQGTVDVFAGILGQNQMGAGWVPILGEAAARNVRDIARGSSGIQAMLPTPSYTQVVFEKGNPRPYPAGHPTSIASAWTFEEFRQRPPSELPADWSLSAQVFGRAQAFHSNFTGSTDIPHVYHLVSRDFDTLEKIVWFLETDIPATISAEMWRYDLRFTAEGDGRVPKASAVVGDPGAKYYYSEWALHPWMPDDQDVGEFAYLRAKNPHDTALPPGLLPVSKASVPGGAAGGVYTIVFQFRVYEFSWPGHPSRPFPITLEIYDKNTGAMLLGTYRLLENGLPSDVATTAVMAIPHPAGNPRLRCVNWSSDDKSQEFWAMDLPDGTYRVIIQPSPEFWFPDEAPAKALATDPGGFDIYGQLAVRDRVSFWSAPSVAQLGPKIHFFGVNGSSGTSNLGFSAYRDYTIQGGVIQGGQDFVHVDWDGDGFENETVTSAPEDNLVSAGNKAALAIHPNPFRKETIIRWNAALGVPRRIDIYRVDGRRVRSATVQTTDRSFLWDGNSDDGTREPSGVYVFRVRAIDGRVLASQKVSRLR